MTTQSFKWTDRQKSARKLLGGSERHFLFRGGSRSGKTFVLVDAVCTRALKAPGSSHAILRHRFNHLKGSVIFDTFPKVMSLRWPNVPYTLNKSDWFCTFPNGSKIWFGGLDDKERTEKILGQEHATIYLNEASQISFQARNMALTRLAQKVDQKDGVRLPLREYCDCNPPGKSHWTYKLWMAGKSPSSGEALPNFNRFATMRLNPADNVENLGEDYLETLEGLPYRERLRFLEGEFLDQVENPLWTADMLEAAEAGDHPPLQRVAIAVDPSGCQGPEDYRSDEVGIIAAGVSQRDGYVLEDGTGRFGPNEWAREVGKMYDRHNADLVVAEKNFGGAMVESTIKSQRPDIKVKLVTASRGKHVRAEPVSNLYEAKRVHHVCRSPDLEEQMMNFSTAGYQGATSPDRADALVWALTELMLENKPAEILGFVG